MNPKLLIIIRSLATVAVGLTINRVPILAPVKEELNTFFVSTVGGCIFWFGIKRAERQANVKQVQSVLGLPETGKFTAETGIAVASAIASTPTQEVVDKAIQAAVNIADKATSKV